jgi:hypothetical protein
VKNTLQKHVEVRYSSTYVKKIIDGSGLGLNLYIKLGSKHSLRMGWRNFFSSCAVVSVFWFLAGNRFCCYLLKYLEYNTVVALC